MALSPMQMSNLNKFLKCSRNEQWLLIQAIILFPFLHIALLTVGYSRLHDFVMKTTLLIPSRNVHSEIEALRRAVEISKSISLAAQHGLIKATCLRRSFLLWCFLRKEGIPGQICFGVRKINHTLEAHAWVELGGIIINDSTEARDNYFVLENTLPPTHTGL
jgi:hypothetical protein